MRMATVVAGLDPPEADCDLTHKYLQEKSGRSHQSAIADCQDPPQPINKPSVPGTETHRQNRAKRERHGLTVQKVFDPSSVFPDYVGG